MSNAHQVSKDFSNSSPTIQTSLPPRKTRIRPARQLVEVTQTAEGETAYRLLPYPPATTSASTPQEIMSAVESAVYEHGMRQYGNIQLAVIALENSFDCPFEERTALVKPKKKAP